MLKASPQEDSISSFESEEDYSFTIQINENRRSCKFIYEFNSFYNIFIFICSSIIIYYGVSYLCYLNNNFFCDLCIHIAIFDIFYFIILNIIYLIKSINF